MNVFESTVRKPSVPIAKDRLKALLVSDRVQCAPDMIDNIRYELFQTVSKYMEVTKEEFDVQLTRSSIYIKLTGEEL